MNVCNVCNAMWYVLGVLWVYIILFVEVTWNGYEYGSIARWLARKAGEAYYGTPQ